MEKPLKMAETSILPANIGLEPGEIEQADSTALVTAFFVAANAITGDGSMHLLVLSPFVFTYAAAEAQAAAIQKSIPQARIAWVHLVYELADQEAFKEFDRALDQLVAERREANYQ